MTKSIPCPSAQDMTDFLRRHFKGANIPEITRAETGSVSLSLACGPNECRPGGIISGPTLMAMADTAGLMGVFSHKGLTEDAFTTSLSIEFLRAAKGDTLHVDADVARFGRTLCIINVSLRGSDMDKTSAQAVVTYATGGQK